MPPQRPQPRKNKLKKLLDQAELSIDDILKVHYRCSGEHKNFAHKNWGNPTPRPDSSICPADLSRDSAILEKMLRTALEKGAHEECIDQFPRYVWFYDRKRDMVFEGRLTQKETGEY